jgi:hypothetical protein
MTNKYVKFLKDFEAAEYKKNVVIVTRQGRGGRVTRGMSRQFVSQNALRASYIPMDWVLQCGVIDAYVGSSAARCPVFPAASPPSWVEGAMVLAARPIVHTTNVGGEEWIPDRELVVIHPETKRHRGIPDGGPSSHRVEDNWNFPPTEWDFVIFPKPRDPVCLSISLLDNGDTIDRATDVESSEVSTEDFQNDRWMKIATALGITMEYNAEGIDS